MLKTIALIAVAGIALVLIAAAFRPDTFRVQRSLRIAAAPSAVHPFINNMAAVNTWSPFVKKDPNIQGRLRGPAAGPGAAYDFQGNREVGAGSIEITSSTPEKITMKLDMTEPMAGHNIVEFHLQPAGSAATDVTWAIHGPSPYLAKLMGLVLDMDKMIGGNFEQGLADLKFRVENRPAA